MFKQKFLILHDIRSVHNVGAIFRTADAVGIDKIYLTGYTPAPIDRFGKKRKDLAKSALGAEEFVPWEIKKSLPAFIRRLRWESFQIIALEQDKKSIDYRRIKLSNKNAFIVGTEVTGIPKSILNKCDLIAEIPMRGKLVRNRLPNDGGKESLNVSVATGIFLFRILDK
jgi:23S rRNA (guanosine2251-2'-O)-methyltransferase